MSIAKTRLIPVIVATLLFSGTYAARAGDLSLGIDPMVLEFTAPYGGEAHGSVSVTNDGPADEVVYAKPVDWRTSSSGDVVFEQPGAERTHSLTNSLTIEPATFVLHAGERREIAVTLRMPSSAGPGSTSLWGGFIVRASASGAQASAATPGGTIFVYDTVGAPRRHLGLVKLEVERDSSTGSRVNARLQNDGETYVRPIVRLLIERGENLVRDTTVPCNVIFAGDRRSLSASLAGLPTGLYKIHMLVKYDGAIVDGVTDARIR